MGCIRGTSYFHSTGWVWGGECCQSQGEHTGRRKEKDSLHEELPQTKLEQHSSLGRQALVLCCVVAFHKDSC